MTYIQTLSRVMTSSLLVFTAACAHIPTERVESVRLGVPLRGQVLYPDTSPASGATVRAETTCPESTIHLVRETIAGPDGTFEIPSFDPFCGRVRFCAESRATYWLTTGSEVFYPGPNGSTPEIDITADSSPQPVTILLGARGGEVAIKVWDEATKRFIHAGLNIMRVPREAQWSGAMSIATGEDGSSHTLFLPVGTYTASIWHYSCGIKTYFVAYPTEEKFEIIPTERVTKTLNVNTFDLVAKSSYDNLGGEKCRP